MPGSAWMDAGLCSRDVGKCLSDAELVLGVQGFAKGMPGIAWMM